MYHCTWFRNGANEKIEAIVAAVDLLKLNIVLPLCTLFNWILSSYKLRLTPNKAKRYHLSCTQAPRSSLDSRRPPFHVVRQSDIDKALNDLSISSGSFCSLYPFRSKSRDDSTLLSHGSPEIIGVEESREFRVDVHDVNIAFCGVSDNSFIVLARYWVCFYIDAESAVNLEF